MVGVTKKWTKNNVNKSCLNLDEWIPGLVEIALGYRSLSDNNAIHRPLTGC